MTAIDRREVVGKLDWTEDFDCTVSVEPAHGTHFEELKDLCVAETLLPRSNWAWTTSGGEPQTASGRWFTLSNYPENVFGPLEVRVPKRVLVGRSFLVVKKETTGLDPLVILLESPQKALHRVPLGWDAAERLGPLCLFEKIGKSCHRRSGTTYQAILTEPVPITDSVLYAADHPRCVLKKCPGISRADVLKELDKVRACLIAEGERGTVKFNAIRHRVHRWQVPVSDQFDIDELVGH